MRKLILAGSVGVVLGVGAFAAAQDRPRVVVRANSAFREQPGLTDFYGNASLTVDGVTVEADRIVIANGKATFEGNVTLSLPRGVPVSELKFPGRVIPIPRQNQP